METSNSGALTVSGTTEESPETTVEIKIKTLDCQTYSLHVNKFMPVTALKEQVANVTGVLSEQQRLICRGKVLKDDQLLSAYNVEDGHILHLVVRQPPLASTTSPTGPENVPNHSDIHPALSTRHNHNISLGRNVLFGAFSLADQGDPVTSEYGQFSQETSSDRPENASGSRISASEPAQTGTNQTAAWMEVNQQQSAFRTPRAQALGQQHPTVIPDSLTTLFQYLSHMKQEFGVNGREHGSSAEAGNMHYGGERSHGTHLDLPLERGLPTPASLAEILLSARQLLMEQAGACLYDLARQLEDHASVTDPLTRTSIQSYAVRSGVLFQNLGSLLLEIGRTTMTLRMGQTPSEAVVNAGPAIFISSIRPNPLMVQAGTSFGGIPTGALLPGHGLGGAPLGSGLLSRNIDIFIHRVPTATTNFGDQAHVQQPSGRTDTTRTSGENFSRQAFQGLPANASISREPAMRVVPSRTVDAMPARVSRPPSVSSGRAVGLFYPLLARFQQRRAGSLNNARISQASRDGNSTGTGAAQQQTPDSAGRADVISLPANESVQEGASGVPSSSRQETWDGSNSNDTQTHVGQQSPQDSLAQIFSRFGDMLRTGFPGVQIQISDISLQGTASGSPAEQTVATTDAEAQVGNDGLLFSGLVRQLMPFISQNVTETTGVSPGNSSSSSGQPEGPNSADSASSLHHHDPPEAPDSKRLKRE